MNARIVTGRTQKERKEITDKGLAAQFVRMAGAQVVPTKGRVSVAGKPTVMKLCNGCGEMMPVAIGAKVCVLCAFD